MALNFWSMFGSTVYPRHSHPACRQGKRRAAAHLLASERLEERALLAIVSHWTADNTATDAVSANHGTLQSGTTYAAGQIGQAFSFDGVNDRIGIADSASLKLTASLTIEGWVRANLLPTQQGEILFRGDDRGGLDPYSLSVQANGDLRFEVSSLIEAMSVSTGMPLGQFVHVAGTLDDATGTMRLYLNGVLMSEATTSVRPFGDLDPASNPGVGIGNHGGAPNTPHNFPFHGLIDELKVYDHALTGTDVLSSFNAGKGSLQPNIFIDDATANEGDARYLYTGDFVPPDANGLAAGRHIVVGSDERVYIASRDSNSVKVFAGGTGAFLGDLTAAPGVLDSPWAIAFGPDGRLYVSGLISHNILSFDVGTGAYDVFVASGSSGLIEPKGLAFGADGNLYISSTAGAGGVPGPHEVLRFAGPSSATPGAPLPAPGKTGAVFVSDGAGNLSNPNGLAFGGSSGNLVG